MQENNLILSTSYLELINDINNIVFKLLYDNESGYTKLSSKDAVENASKVIENFNYEVQKIAQNSKFDDTDSIIEEKRKELIEKVTEYSKQESVKWSEEVFDKFIDNSLFLAFIYKNNPDSIKRIMHAAFGAINWFSGIKGFSKEERNYLIKDFNQRLQKTIMSKNEDYISKENSDKTDEKIFLMLRDDFLKKPVSEINLENYKGKLDKNDISYFNGLMNNFSGFRKFQARDEIILVNTAIELMKLKDDKDKYNFIKEVDGDITVFLVKNKKIEDEEKIEIIKKRMKLFKDSFEKKETSEYFKKLLVS